jgi:hypothetical protein
LKEIYKRKKVVLIYLKIARRRNFTIICVSRQEHWEHHATSIPNFLTVICIVCGMLGKDQLLGTTTKHLLLFLI